MITTIVSTVWGSVILELIVIMIITVCTSRAPRASERVYFFSSHSRRQHLPLICCSVSEETGMGESESEGAIAPMATSYWQSRVFHLPRAVDVPRPHSRRVCLFGSALRIWSQSRVGQHREADRGPMDPAAHSSDCIQSESPIAFIEECHGSACVL